MATPTAVEWSSSQERVVARKTGTTTTTRVTAKQIQISTSTISGLLQTLLEARMCSNSWKTITAKTPRPPQPKICSLWTGKRSQKNNWMSKCRNLSRTTRSTSQRTRAMKKCSTMSDSSCSSNWAAARASPMRMSTNWLMSWYESISHSWPAIVPHLTQNLPLERAGLTQKRLASMQTYRPSLSIHRLRLLITTTMELATITTCPTQPCTRLLRLVLLWTPRQLVHKTHPRQQPSRPSKPPWWVETKK